MDKTYRPWVTERCADDLARWLHAKRWVDCEVERNHTHFQINHWEAEKNSRIKSFRIEVRPFTGTKGIVSKDIVVAYIRGEGEVVE